LSDDDVSVTQFIIIFKGVEDIVLFWGVCFVYTLAALINSMLCAWVWFNVILP